MEVYETLDKLYELAEKDEDLRQRLLATRTSATPLADFCAASTAAGLPLYEMDLVEYGESFYAAIKRSTNGGGEKTDGSELPE